MKQIINITQARKNFSNLVENVYKNNESVILLRDSAPQAVIISYKEYEKQEETWKKEFIRLMDDSKKSFKQYLKKTNTRYPKSEEEMYDLINKTTSRS
ncbi:hypothetical protein A3F34_02370 [Candidatus Roizmanbacteria bacterium RIFCSPHIGHO2_12_FULL_44_10]|uniref:Antitoxin n=1 Tax=Candidatus Roizmanbacteria bacterium RIFCSPHIGHO2_12_FULL_44_10 TaxID=1802054 RepID=A0A1F7I9F9_9BACT|nr:MAG: hypothetical protein A3F34_02370 [Candidatus Roizmanbacteria bacterium RIFCSPHIGHO2_12_FULL_44_10]